MTVNLSFPNVSIGNPEEDEFSTWWGMSEGKHLGMMAEKGRNDYTLR